jgi:histidinol-phosphatase (PHP family)
MSTMTETAPGTGSRVLPADSHVHSQWSWDALAGSMEGTCQRAVEIGLPAVAFTEHADFTPWSLGPDLLELVPDDWQPRVSDGVLTPPPLDLDGYLGCLDRCRGRFPGLRILSGVELGEPHWHSDRVAALLRAGGFDRVLASVHSAPTGAGFTELSDGFRGQDPARVLRAYLAETTALITRFDAFEVLAHIDYPVRYWPDDARPHDPEDFQDEYRQVLRHLAEAGKALEVNTRVPLHPQVLAWWRQEGGRAITFASDAHDPAKLAARFTETVRVAEAAGFGAGRDPSGFWGRVLPALDDHDVRLAAALAHRDQAAPPAGALEGVQQRGEQPRAGRAEGVAEGDGAAAGVDAGEVGAGLALPGEHDRGERLVDLDQIDLVEREPGPA